jgi:OOP family OmpA-OmpF porin
MESVMDMARMAFGKDTLTRLSSWLGEGPAETKAAVQDAIPASLVGLADQASTEEGSRALLGRLQRGDYPQLDVGDLDRAASDPETTDRLALSSQGLMAGMFGGKLGSLTDGIARHAGISRGAVSKLLALATPLVMSLIGKQTASQHLDAGGLRRYLGEERNAAAGLLPGPLANLLGPGQTAAAAAVVPHRRGFPWWIVGLLVLLAGIAYALSRIGRRESARAPATVTAPMSPPTETLTTGDVSAFNRVLEGSTPLPQRFVLDLKFTTDSADIEAGSRSLLDDLAGALASHPQAKIRVEGHTDATGAPEVNRQLSQARAEATRSYLGDKGIEASRIETAGFGAERPVASNDTATGRAENRRTELVLIAR